MTIDIEKLKGEAKYQREKALRAAVKLGHNMTTFSAFKLAFTPAAGLVRDTYHNEAACKLCGASVRVAWSEVDGWSSVPITRTCLDLAKGPAPLPPEAQTGFVAEIAETAAAEYHGTQPPTPPAVEISGEWTPADPQQALGRASRQPQLKIGDIVGVRWIDSKERILSNPTTMITEDLGDAWKTHQGHRLDKRTLIFDGDLCYAVPLTTSCEKSGRLDGAPGEVQCVCGVTVAIGPDGRVPQHSRPAGVGDSADYSTLEPRFTAPSGVPTAAVEILNRTPDPIEEHQAYQKKAKITPRRQMTEAEKKARKRRNKAAAQARRRNR